MEDDAMELEESIQSTLIIEHGAASKSQDVVVLDEDEELGAKKASKSVEIIDLVPQCVSSKCVNYACKSGVDLVQAPGFCLSYYRVKNASNGKLRDKEVCRECFTFAVDEYEMLIGQLKLGKLLCNVDLPLRNDTFEIDDSDEENDNDAGKGDAIVFEGQELDFLKQHFERVLDDQMTAVKYQGHINNEINSLTEKSGFIGDVLSEMQKSLKETRATLDDIQKELYGEFRQKTYEQTVLTIIDDTSLFLPLIQMEKSSSSSQLPTVRPQKRPVKQVEGILPRKSLRSGKRVSYNELEEGASSPLMQNDDFEGNKQCDVVIETPPDLPPIGVMQKPQLILNEIYFITRENITNGSWIKARFKGVESFTDIQGQIQFKFQELKQLKKRILTGKNLAYFHAAKIRCEIGTRVIAVFKNISDDSIMVNENRLRHELYYPGIVAEPPVEQNRHRYLIFFDIGYSQYVDYKKVNLIYESSTQVWEDIPINSRMFIKKYLESTDRPMVKLQSNEKVRVEYNGKWLQCTVKQIDCSLVLVSFDHVVRLEWIYRGSTRLKPMFKEEQNATKRHTGGRTCGKTQQTQQIVQYTKNCDFEKKIENVRSVARKSTSVRNFIVNGNNGNNNMEGPNIVRFLPQFNAMPPPVEPTSKIMYFTPRDQIITQRLYRPHACSTACKDYIRHNSSKLRAHNPLSKPLLCGWARVTLRVRGRREIVYKAPCSRMLRNIQEIHQYLRMTKSDMTVDLFDFNVSVRCLAEFNVECEPEPKDLSRGLENVPIPVINGIDNDILDFCNYDTKRVPMEEVQLNTDPDFLCSCDCEDDCVDKTKCSCWKLTLEGAKFMGKNVDPDSIGYVYRRLPEQVLTGIYECNSRCKCASTCLNRVVQNPMSLKLQVFKTHNRGWGIRCVNDVPQGAFICIYAGTIHTEQMANQDGQTYGDEYFAELDYIENCERHKDDYEAEAMEPDETYDNKTNRNERRNKNNADNDDDDEEEEDEEYVFGGRKGNEDSDFVPFGVGSQSNESWMKLRKRNETKIAKTEMKIKKKEDETNDGNKEETIMISDDEDDPKEVLNFNPSTVSDLDESKPQFPSVRSFFGEDEPYIMDTKNAGNIGRFLNHSCSPNVFVQNVFVDTHDVRFPWVAFFCQQFIRAGTELTWNYNYDIGSVPGRVLYCHCGSLECKGRML